MKNYYTHNSEVVQKKLFKAGYSWLNSTDVHYLECPYVCFKVGGDDKHLQYCSSTQYLAGKPGEFFIDPALLDNFLDLEPVINLNECVKGDVLVSRNGAKCVYYEKLSGSERLYSHRVTHPQHGNITYTSEGLLYAFGSISSQDNIIKVIKQVVPDFSSLPEGSTEIVINGKRYQKTTKTITEWVEKK